MPEATRAPTTGRPAGRASRLGLRAVALVYVSLILLLPLAMLCYRTFEHGVGPVWDALTDPAALHAFRVTLVVAFWAVLGDTIFGLGAAILIVRHEFRGKRIFSALIDLPLALSPVIAGLSLVLVYGPDTAIGGWFGDLGIDIVYAPLGMVIATMFASLPLVVREVVPVLQEIGDDQEQAAWTLGASSLATFRRITFPAIRWALGYGVVLTLARSLGEFGAVAVVSGNVVDKTQTATLLVRQEFLNFNQQGAYAIAFALAALAVVALVFLTLLRPKEHV